ncbi:hypothetical protein D3C80_1441130 [compost metagenome]|jgi:hypothetical protein
MDLRMGQPTLNAWEICFVGWMVCLGLPIQGASPSVLLHRAVRRPLAVRTELNRFPSIVIRYLTFEYIGVRSERRELKHLSTCRKGHQPRLRK